MKPYSAESGLNPVEQIHLKAEELLGSVMFKLSVDKNPRGASVAAGKSWPAEVWNRHIYKSPAARHHE